VCDSLNASEINVSILSRNAEVRIQMFSPSSGKFWEYTKANYRQINRPERHDGFGNAMNKLSGGDWVSQSRNAEVRIQMFSPSSGKFWLTQSPPESLFIAFPSNKSARAA
jgi:hypothetical protein